MRRRILGGLADWRGRLLFPTAWQIATEAITAAVMLWFAIRLLLHFP